MSPDKDLLNEGYPLRIRLIVTGLVLVLAVIALTFPRFTSRIRFNPQSFEEVVETFDIPPTRQFEAPPPPARPSIPVESENENLAEDITIEETELENFEWEAPPPPPIEEGPVVTFIPYDEPPEPIGGYEAMLRNVRYPPHLEDAGIEGNVVVQAFVDKTGKVIYVKILKGVPEIELNEAALDAIKKTRFRPAKQRDIPVGVWISLPVTFRIGL